MQPLNVTGLIVVVAIVALAGIDAIVVATTSASLLVQSASAGETTPPTTNVTTKGTIASSTKTNNNSFSNITLGNLLAVSQGINETYNQINDTYAVVSYLDSLTLIPPNDNTTTISATENGNSTVSIQPNGDTLVQGRGLLMTQGDGDGTQKENATTTFVSLGTTNPNGTASRIGVVGKTSRIGVVFFSTNSTGQLAFLDNMIGIYQAESSQEGVTSRVWEWKENGMLTFETGRSAPITGNQTTTNGAVEEEQTMRTMNNISTNDVSNTLLSSRLLSFGEGKRISFNPVNDTYTEISVVSSTTIVPPNDTTPTTTINMTEKGNLTFNIQPNGVTLAQGQVLLETQDDNERAAQKENATATIAEINRIGPEGIGSATGVIFYNTNSTGKLAFLDNMIGVYQRDITPKGSTIRTWEWK